MDKYYEIRDPIHGFIELNDWEWDIINHPVFQRLRRIKQLSLTDMVYPGAMHTRFEHSLGVMHVATRMFDHICKRRKDFLKSELKFNDAGLDRDRTLIRLSCLLHDVGHAPFSHAAEGLMDEDPLLKRPYKHEQYSAAAIVYLMRDIIENHNSNNNYKIKADEIADFLNGKSILGRSLLWRDLVTSQLDADRADYLLRDSHHIGVAYGHYDLDRLIATLTVAINFETSSPTIAIEEGGEHAAEALIIARYMMFTQVYFHHARRAYDYHIVEIIKYLLSKYQKLNNKNTFPPPTSEKFIKDYLKWDDWRVMGLISEDKAGEHGRILIKREHYRAIFETPEIPSLKEQNFIEKIREKLNNIITHVDCASCSWYKFESADVPLLLQPGHSNEKLISLSEYSSVVNGLKAIKRIRVYVPMDKREQARNAIIKMCKE